MLRECSLSVGVGEKEGEKMMCFPYPLFLPAVSTRTQAGLSSHPETQDTRTRTHRPQPVLVFAVVVYPPASPTFPLLCHLTLLPSCSPSFKRGNRCETHSCTQAHDNDHHHIVDWSVCLSLSRRPCLRVRWSAAERKHERQKGLREKADKS